MKKEIDYLIAEHIFAYDFVDWEEPSKHPIPNYSINIADAWLVVDKMGGMRNWSLNRRQGRQWEVSTNEIPNISNMGYARDKTAPMAICLAALKAKNIEVEQGE